MIYWLFLLIIAGAPSVAEAACSNPSSDGVTWTCTPPTSVAQIASALSSASDGAVLTFTAGSYAWSGSGGGISTQDMTKGFTLICATVGACNVTLSNGTFWFIDFIGTVDKLFRLSGFNFSGSCGGNGCIDMRRNASGGINNPALLRKVRIDHNTITINPMTTQFVFMGAYDRRGEVNLLFDHNTINSGNAAIFLHMVAGHDITNAGTPEPWGVTSRGSENAVYVEDNTITYANENGYQACTDMHQGGKTVIRFNTILNCRPQTHGMAHGGNELWEVYYNDIRTTVNSGGDVDCYACIQTQGIGEFFVFNNRIRGLSSVNTGAAITTQNYRSGSAQPGSLGLCDGTKAYDGNTPPTTTYRGYPCVGQPGYMEAHGSPLWGKLSPNAAWGNFNGHNNTLLDLNIRGNGPPDYDDEHMVENRDYYNAVSLTANSCVSPGVNCSPFNGTTGIGVGTLANRPNTCTHTTTPLGDEGGGVMYWATDQGSWNQSTSNPYGVQANGADGVLYRCSATNTWTLHYTPYTYPHPLQGGGTPPDTTPPAAPTGVTISKLDTVH